MWKAIIKLIKKWAYRCNHKFELIDQIRVYHYELDVRIRVEYLFICKKCGKSKVIKSKD